MALILLLLLAAAPRGVRAGTRNQDAPAAPAGAKKAKAGKEKTPAPPAEYVGADTCVMCHEDKHADQLPYHKAIETTKRLGWQGKTCEACHGPGKAHAESGDPKLIFSFKNAPAAKVAQTCLTCHAQGLKSNDRAFDAHSRNSVTCTNCHTVHASKARMLLVGKPEQFCVTCHSNVRAEFNRPFRHRLNEGVIGCLDCHNPHGSAKLGGVMKAQLRTIGGNEPACFKCHADLRGPFTFEHMPVRTSGCQSCHEPHGSVNPRMLIRSDVRFMCLECHTNSTTALGQSPPAFHDLRTPRFQNCTVCHNRIHGSYVDQFFER